MSTTEETREGFYLGEDGEWLPDGWEVLKLGDLATFSYGKMPQKDKLTEGGNYRTFSGYKYQYRYPESNCSKGDIIVVARGVGGTGDIKIVAEDCYLTNLSIKISSDDNLVDKSYFYYFHLLSNLRYLDSGSAQSQITINDLERYELPLPKLEEQKAIAAVLGSLDDKIELLREQNETLETLAQTLFKCWFIDFNFPDENGNPYKDSGGKMLPSELGEIPEEWESDRIDSKVKLSGGGTPSTKESSYWDGGIPWTSPKDLSERPYPFLSKTNKTLTEEGLAKITSGLKPEGSLLLSSRAPIGYIAFTEMPVAVNQGYIAFEPGSDFTPQFMYLWLRCFMPKVINAANGSTFLEISKKAFKDIVTIIPDADSLEYFGNVVHPIFEKMKFNLRQIETTTKLRDTLLPKLMKGEIRISL